LKNKSNVDLWDDLLAFDQPTKTGMKAFIPIYAISILLGTNAFANSQSSTAEGVDKEITINRLMSKVPQGATVTDTSCKEIGTAGFNIRYRCTITWQ
tara:strand:+ start:143 stop:433 length:291 start_codon:yes stop_codon:yes gene_type:complete